MVGEARTNENSVLQSHHTVWMRTHNVVAKQLKQLNPSWDSERVMQVLIQPQNRRIYVSFHLPPKSSIHPTTHEAATQTITA